VYIVLVERLFGWAGQEGAKNLFPTPQYKYK
jgi:hypothetical protein